MPQILDLKTNLKSLKYGQDQPGGGNSGQPYQQVDINKVDSGFNRFRMTKFDDGLVRGGVVGAANASIVDTFRIGKFFTDFPKGPLFIVKQVGLQLANPKLEAKKLNTSLPTGGQGFLRNVGNFIANTANKVVNAVGPTRIYNLGINTLAQVPLNAFGQHLVRHGILPVMDDSTKYLAVAEANNQGVNAPNNRLVDLKTRFRLGDMTTSANPQFFSNAQRRAAGQVVAGLFSLATGTASKPKPIGFLNANGELAIDRYIGGAQSVYGIGNTTILRRAFTEDAAKIDAAKNRNYVAQTVPTILIRKTADFGVSTKTKSIFGRTVGSNTNNPFGLQSAGTIETFNLNNGTNGSFLNFIASNKDKTGVNFTKLKASLDNATKNIPSFLRLSNRTSSTFVAAGFPGLKALPNIPSTLLDKTIKTYEPSLKAGTFTPASIIASSKDNTVSKKVNSKFINTGFPGLDSGGNILPTADDKTIKTYQPSLKAGTFTPAAVISGSRDTVSKRNNSDYSKSGFPGLDSTSNVPSTAKDKTVKTYKRSLFGAQVNASADLGKGSKAISTYDSGSSTLTEAKVDQNVIPYGASKTYAALRSKIKTSISQPTAGGPNGGAGGINFTTDATINMVGKTGAEISAALLNAFNRGNDRVIDLDSMALIFNPLDPFTGNPLKTLKFLGYITDYTENYDSGWGDVKYTGRAESFYVFNSFKRSVNVGFNIPCFRKEELEERHCALSELASVLAGKYSDNGLLGGIITRLKLGGYINNQPGIINTLTFNPIQDSSWDLDSGLAFYLKVSFTFTVIHNFLPQFKDCGFLKDPLPIKQKDPEPKKEQEIIPQQTSSIAPPPGGDPIVTLPDLGATRQRAAIDNTRVVPQNIKQIPKVFGGFGGGSFGGAGAGGSWDYVNAPKPTTTGPVPRTSLVPNPFVSNLGF